MQDLARLKDLHRAITEVVDCATRKMRIGQYDAWEAPGMEKALGVMLAQKGRIEQVLQNRGVNL